VTVGTVTRVLGADVTDARVLGADVTDARVLGAVVGSFVETVVGG